MSLVINNIGLEYIILFNILQITNNQTYIIRNDELPILQEADKFSTLNNKKK